MREAVLSILLIASYCISLPTYANPRFVNSYCNKVLSSGQLVAFDAQNHSWSSNSITIPGITTPLYVITQGRYSWVMNNSQPSPGTCSSSSPTSNKISFNSGSGWQPAHVFNDFDIYSLHPGYPQKNHYRPHGH